VAVLFLGRRERHIATELSGHVAEKDAFNRKENLLSYFLKCRERLGCPAAMLHNVEIPKTPCATL